MQPPQQSHIIKRVIIAIIVILVVIGVLVAYGHGTAQINLQDKGNFTVKKDDDPNAETRKGDSSRSIVLPSGDYTVTYTDDNTTYSRALHIGHFLSSSQLDLATKLQRHVVRLWPNTQAAISISQSGTTMYSINPLNGDLIESYDLTGSYNATPRVKNTPFKQGNTLVGRQIIGFAPYNQGKVNGLQPATYSLETGSVSRLDTVYDSPTSQAIVPSSAANDDAFGVLFNKDNTDKLDIYVGAKKAGSFDVTGSAAASATNSAVSLNSQVAAVAYGVGYQGGGRDESEHEVDRPSTVVKPQPYRIISYDVTTQKKIHDITIGKTNSVAGISISPKGTYVAARYDDKVAVFRMDDGSQVTSQAVTYAYGLSWVDDSRLLYGSATSGLYELDTNEQSASTIFSTKSLRVSDFKVSGDQVYFSAFSNQPGFSGNQRPDAYVAYLNKQADDNNDLANKLPYKTGTLSMTSYGNDIYVTSLVPVNVSQNDVSAEFRGLMPSSQSASQDAIDYLKNNVKNYQKYKVLLVK